MAVQTNTNIEDLLGQIGDYQKRTVEISFPEDFPEEALGVKGYAWPHIWRGQTNPKLYGFSGSDWQFQLAQHIGDHYGSLICDEEHPALLPIPPKTKPLATQYPFHIEFGHFIGEAVGNAVRHGNKFDVKKKATIDSYTGEHGIVWSVTDEGEGFDAQETIDKFLEGDETYHHPDSYGNGFRSWMTPWHIQEPSEGNFDFTFAFNEAGNQWMFMYLFDKNRYKPKDWKAE